MDMLRPVDIVIVLEKNIKELEELVNKKKVKKEILLSDEARLSKEVEELKIVNYERAAVYMKQLAQKQKENACEELTKLGTAALQYCFGPSYKMKIEMEGTSKNPKADLWIIQDDNDDEKEDPMEDNGGGIVDIVGNAMRLVILDNYTEPVIDGPIILDEPFKMVSKEYIPQMAEFIKNVSRDFRRQVIVVTHSDYLSSMTDTNIYVSLEKTGKRKKSIIEIQANTKED